MPIFKLPLIERVVFLSPDPLPERAYICIDGGGLSVYFRKGDDPRPENIRSYLVGTQDDYCYVPAANLEAAIIKFHTEWTGAMTGETYKALIINREEPILEYPECDRLTCSSRGEYWCDEAHNEEGNPCGCVLSKCDPPDPKGSCPIDQFLDNVRDGEHIICLTKRVEPYGEFLVISHCPNYAIVSMV